VISNRFVAVPVLVLALLVAGCAGPSSATKNAGQPSSETSRAPVDDSEKGQVLGRVLDDEFQLLGGVLARIDGTDLSLTTADDGVFFFRDVPAGPRQVSLSKAGFTPKNLSVDVLVDERVKVEVFLIKAPNLKPYVDDGFTFRGQINCSGRVNASNTDANPECGAVEPQFDQGRTTFLEFIPNMRWTLIEIEWVPSVPGVNSELTLAIRPFIGESWKQIEGPSPIQVLLGPEDWTAIKEYANRDYPKNGGQLQLYMFPGEPANANGVGAGAAVVQDFTIYATSWYGMDPEPAFTRLAPS
jgi:hypothetical protein